MAFLTRLQQDLVRNAPDYELTTEEAKWECGLTKGDSTKMHQLRLHYIKEIAISEFNLHKENYTNVGFGWLLA
nr:zinc finger BED domain-containing protein RICESLEEPER 2-like [Ipomoea batatas]